MIQAAGIDDTTGTHWNRCNIEHGNLELKRRETYKDGQHYLNVNPNSLMLIAQLFYCTSMLTPHPNSDRTYRTAMLMIARTARIVHNTHLLMTESSMNQ